MSDPDFVRAELRARRLAARSRAAEAAPHPTGEARLTRGPRGWFVAGERLQTGDLVEVWTNPRSGWVRGRVRLGKQVELIIPLTSSDITDLDPERTHGVLTGELPAGTHIRKLMEG